MVPTIFSLGIGIPAYCHQQSDIAQQLIERLFLNEKETWMVKKIYDNSQISQRYSVIPDLLFSENNQSIMGMRARNEMYKKEAPPLAERAARDALKTWDRPLNEITHVISVSCTGAITPGIEFKLIQALGLEPSICRLGINFMGCFGAFKGLSVAHKIACESPKNRVLVVCTELCTLHFHPDKDIKSMIIQSLFADGAAAAIIGTNPRKGEIPLFEIFAEKSLALENSEDDITWMAGDHGFDMTLSAGVPAQIEKHIKAFVTQLINSNHPLETFEWAVHPGGKSILEAVQTGLNLTATHMQSSWNILANYGNLSSGTFLFILKDLLQSKTRHPWSVGLGFGPGLSFEGLLLQNLT